LQVKSSIYYSSIAVDTNHSAISMNGQTSASQERYYQAANLNFKPLVGSALPIATL
jgi:hypothetical protein